MADLETPDSTDGSVGLFARTSRLLRKRQFILLALALMAQLFLFPALSDFKIKGAVVSELFMFLVILGVARSVAHRRGVRVITIIMLSVLLVSRLIAADSPTSLASIIAISLNILVFGYIMALMMGFVLGAGRVTADKIDAAICVYLMYGLIGALSYSLVALLQPGAFAFSAGLQGGEGAVIGFSHFLYYSFVTQTSLGFGDMTPTSSMARSLTVMHAATTQIYMTVLVARLVGLFTAYTHETRRPEWSDQ